MAHYMLLLLLCLLSTGVLAGSRAWEFSLQYTEVIHASAFTSTENSTTNSGSTNQRRWLTVRPGAAQDKTWLWPDRTIRYCYADAESKSQLETPFWDARLKWFNSGLSPQQFHYVEVSDSECISNRVNVLLISYNDNERLSTTPGLPSTDDNEDYEGPTMTLSTSDKIGMLDTVANIAHEIGHAWGLYHEHQNELFWQGASASGPYGTKMGTVFSAANFYCQNLVDYAKAMESTEWCTAKEKESMCTSRAAAAKCHFSAFDYLPIVKDYRAPTGRSTGRGEGDVDWDSIMIYPSGAGAGRAEPGNDNRPNILTKPDGSRIEKNTNPSPQDIQGLIDLYGTENWMQANPVLINQGESTKNSRFKFWRKWQKCL